MKNGGSEGVKAGAVVLRPITGSVGCRILDEMRRCTPKGAAKPWKTAENVALVERVAGAGVPPEELESYVRGCAELVSGRKEAPIYWTVRQLFSAPTMDWWRNKVEAMRYAAEQREAHELNQAAQAERERIEREARRSAAGPSTVDFAVRRAAEPLRAEVVQRARAQELTASVVARLERSQSATAACPRCEAKVMLTEAACPACRATLIDASGQRRRGFGRGVA